MQRGTRLTLAVAILLAGATAAMMFRREKSTGESAAAAAAEPAPLKSLAGGTPASAPHLTGRIESSNHAQLSTGPIEVPPSPLAIVPTAAVLPRENHFFADDSAGDGSEMAKTHKIRDGDTLSELARRYLGRRERFMEIFEANRDKLTSPDLLPIGKELRIPRVNQNPF